ncbi:MAG: hypothetical protein SFT81_07735 [Candidatus Caenarcaniphilales bacterium]|nr:hypothetical protein [Candidatus Caenarcaniphilales bacterium]
MSLKKKFLGLVLLSCSLGTLLPIYSDDTTPIQEELLPLDILDEEALLEVENLLASNDKDIPTLKGSANRVLEKEEKVAISLMSLLSSEFSTVGDGVEALILVPPGTPNISLASLRGSRLLGQVIEVKPSRKAGRAGYVKVVFDRLQIKSGKEFPIHAEMSTESFKGQEAMKLVVEDIKLVSMGAVWGTMTSLKWAPIPALTTNGLSLAAGAALGASLGIVGAIRREGEVRTLFPGEKESIKLKDPLRLSDEIIEEAAFASQTVKNELIGLRLEPVTTSYYTSDDFSNLLILEVKVNNQSDTSIYPCDILLLPKDGGNPIVADVRSSGTELLKSVPAGEMSTVRLVYPITEKSQARDFSLALYDPLDKVFIAEMPL